MALHLFLDAGVAKSFLKLLCLLKKLLSNAMFYYLRKESSDIAIHRNENYLHIQR